MIEPLPFSKECPAYIITDTEDGPRVLARFFENKRRDTATVLVPDAFSTNIEGVSYKVLEEHYSVHALDRADGRLIKWTSVYEPTREETHAALIQCQPAEFIWPVTSRLYAFAGKGNLPTAYNGPLFRLPYWRVSNYRLIISFMVSSPDQELPQINGWGRLVLRGTTFRLTVCYTFLLGPAQLSTNAIHHITSSPQVDRVPQGDFKQPERPMKKADVLTFLANDRQSFIEVGIERMRRNTAIDPEFHRSMGPLEDRIASTREMWSMHIDNPFEFETRFLAFRDAIRDLDA